MRFFVLLFLAVGRFALGDHFYLQPKSIYPQENAFLAVSHGSDRFEAKVILATHKRKLWELRVPVSSYHVPEVSFGKEGLVWLVNTVETRSGVDVVVRNISPKEKKQQQLSFRSKSVYPWGFSKNGEQFALMVNDVVSLFDSRSLKPIAKLDPLDKLKPRSKAVFFDGNSKVAVGFKGETYRMEGLGLFEVKTGKFLEWISLPSDSYNTLQIDESGKTIGVVTYGRIRLLRKGASGKWGVEKPMESVQVQGASFSADFRVVAVVSDYSGGIYEVASSKPISILSRSYSSTYGGDVILSEDARKVVLATGGIPVLQDWMEKLPSPPETSVELLFAKAMTAEPSQAFAAMRELENPGYRKALLALLKKQLAAEPDGVRQKDRFDRSVEDLDDEDFDTRQAAEEKILEMSSKTLGVYGWVQQALAAKPSSLEVRHRLSRIAETLRKLNRLEGNHSQSRALFLKALLH